MKLLLSILALTITVVLTQSCSDAEASKPAKEATPDLTELGFVSTNNSQTLKEDYLNKTGLALITDQEMDSIVLTNNFVLNSASAFKGVIPEDKKFEIVRNYKRAATVNVYVRFHGWGSWTKLGEYGSDKDKGVFVVAPPELFTRAANLDPIVVVKTDGGWLELARW